MGFPAGMQLATIAFGIPLTATGKDVVTTVTVKPTSRVIWAATGQPLPEFSDSFTAAAGQLGTFQVPFVNQAGFIDSTGATVTDFAYQISGTWTFGNEKPIGWSKNLKPLVGQSGTIDLDLVPDGSVSIPVTAPTAAMLAFHGRTGMVTLQESDLPIRLSVGELSATYAHPFMPEKYGAAAAYNVAVDDTAAVQAAINAAQAIGGTVLLNRQYRVTTLTITAAIKMHGSGGKRVNAANLRTGFVVNSATADILTCSADGVILEDFSIFNEVVTPTAGAGIRVTAGDYVHISRLTVWNFYDNVVFDNGYYYDINGCTILDPVRYGLLLRNNTVGEGDHGDQSVTNCVIAGLVKNRVHTASVKWESGGGLRFIGNKTNGSLTPEGGGSAIGIGLHIAVADGVDTSVFTIVGNSIEAWNIAGVLIEHGGPLNTGGLRKIAITGNEIAGNTSGPAVAIQMATGGVAAQQVVIEGNTLGNYSDGITLRNVRGVTIGHNVHGSVGAGTVVAELGSVTDLFMAPQTVIGDNINLYGVTSMDSGSAGPFQQAGFDFHRETGTVSSNTVYTDLWRVTVPTYGAGRLKFTVAGNLNGVGAFVYSAEYLFTRATAAVTATIIGTASTAGGVIDVAFDTATTSGEIRIGVKRNGANGTSFNGRAHLAVDGTVAGVKKGA